MLRPRVLVYGTVLGAICAALAASLWLRTPFRVVVVRDRGSLARIVEDGRVENVYRLQIMNASEQLRRYHIEVESDKLDDAHVVGSSEVEVGPAEARWVPVAVRVPDKAAREAGPGAHRIEFEITQQATDAGERLKIKERSTFVVPR